MNEEPSYFAFAGTRHVGTGDLKTVLDALRAMPTTGEAILIFEAETGKQVEFDLRSTDDLSPATAAPSDRKTGPGRPRLGVVGGEVTLMPRQWAWLERQPNRASATLRRLVDAAIKHPDDDSATRARVDATGKFLWAIAGNFENFEEATRALYAQSWRRLHLLMAGWPHDISQVVTWLLRDVRGVASLRRIEWQGRRIEVLPRGPDRRSGEEEGTSICDRTAVELVASVAAGRVSARELVDAHLDRILAVNPRVNALTQVFGDQARKTAAELDARLESGEAVGPLAGLPFTVKENIDVAGQATTHGSAAMRDRIAPRDAPLVERLRRAGAIPVAHSNLPDLSLRFHTRSQLYGHTLNPWNPALSPGGSSGGEAVAIATGMSPLGLGNDAGGSVRVPAALAGVCSLKPSYGRFPSDSSTGPRNLTLASQLIPVEGLLARSVADLHLVFQIASGVDPRDPRVVPAPLWGPEVSGNKKVAVLFSACGVPLHAEVEAAVRRAAEVLEGEGYELVETELPGLAEIGDAYGGMIMTEFDQIRGLLGRLLNEDSRRYIDYASALRPPVDLPGYLQLPASRQGFQRDWADFFETYAVALGPVLTDPFFPVDFDIRGPQEHAMVTHSLCLCAATSFLGVPAVSLPVGIKDGHPLGVQVISSWYREDLCLRAAGQIEGRLGIFTPIEPRPGGTT